MTTLISFKNVYLSPQGLFSKNRESILKNVSFEINAGDTIGILGLNGSGKSTILKLCAGLIYPTSGTVEVAKNVNVSLLSLNSGFFPNLSGYENAVLLASWLINKNQNLETSINKIHEFSGLDHAFFDPVNTYSNGMKSALGFSIASYVKSDVLLVDETLSVGDKNFSRKSKNKIEQLVDSGTAFVLASHSANKINSYCAKCILVSNGEVMAAGQTSELVELYACI